MRYKIGVKLPKVLDPRMFIALDAIERAWESITGGEGEPTITSWADGSHMVGSYHKLNGRAVDVRTKSLLPGLAQVFAIGIRTRIGALGFDVLLEDLGGENEHLHVEADQRMDEQ